MPVTDPVSWNDKLVVVDPEAWPVIKRHWHVESVVWRTQYDRHDQDQSHCKTSTWETGELWTQTVWMTDSHVAKQGKNDGQPHGRRVRRDDEVDVNQYEHDPAQSAFTQSGLLITPV